MVEKDFHLDKFNWKHLVLLIGIVLGVFFLAKFGFQNFSNSDPVVSISVNENSLSPSRPALGPGDPVRFVNKADRPIFVRFERGGEDFSLSPEASIIRKLEVTSYYTVERGNKTFRGSIVVQRD